MFLKSGAFQELVLLSLNAGTTRLDSLFNKLSIFSKEEITKELVALHNSKVIEFDTKERIVILTKKMKDTIDFLHESRIMDFYNEGIMSDYLNRLSGQVDIDFNSEINSLINNCLIYLYKTDFSNEISVLQLSTEKRVSNEH